MAFGNEISRMCKVGDMEIPNRFGKFVVDVIKMQNVSHGTHLLVGLRAKV